MKKFTLTAFMFLLFALANAQFSKGDRYLSGSFSGQLNDYDMDDRDGVESYAINFAPSFYHFKSDRKAAGFKMFTGFQYAKSYTPTGTTRSRMGYVGAGIFSQNYFNLNKGFYLVVEKGIGGTVSFGSNAVLANPAGNADITHYGINLYFTPGIGYKLTNRLIVGLNLNNMLSLGYMHTSVKYPTFKAKNNAVSISSGLNSTSLGSIGINLSWKLK